jgi:hypothetical protein
MKSYKEYSKLVKKYNPTFIVTDQDKEPIKRAIKESLGTTDHTTEYSLEYNPFPINNINKIHNKPHLGENELNSIGVYSGHSSDTNLGNTPEANYKHINSHIRSGDKADTPENREIKKHIENIDSAMSKHTTNVDSHVWRGLAGFKNSDVLPEHLNSLKHGDIFHDKGYFYLI